MFLEAQVYLFGHRNAATPLPVVKLSVRHDVDGPSRGASLSLSARHFIPVASNATAPVVSTYALDVQPGNVVTMIVNGRPAAGTVIAKRAALEQGAFNPYTKVRRPSPIANTLFMIMAVGFRISEPHNFSTLQLPPQSLAHVFVQYVYLPCADCQPPTHYSACHAAGWQHLRGWCAGILPQRLVPGRPGAAPRSALCLHASCCLSGVFFTSGTGCWASWQRTLAACRVTQAVVMTCCRATSVVILAAWPWP